jgi:transposase-like protein
VYGIDITLARLSKRYKAQFNNADWLSFRDRFAREEDCVALLFQAKWPNGFNCPRCNHSHAYVINSRRLPLYQCRGCRHQTSLTVGTIMENSRTPMSKWLSTYFLISRTDSDINAEQLRQLILVTYKTAWAMLHAIRQAISVVDSEQLLSGNIKGGIGFCGQLPYSPTMTRDPQEKPVLFCASLDGKGQPISFKMKLVQHEHMKNKYLERTGIQQFIHRYVQQGEEEVQFLQRFALYKILPVKELFDQTMHRFRRSFRGLRSRHLQLYLDEASYRINMTLQDKPILESLSQLCMTTQRYRPNTAA